MTNQPIRQPGTKKPIGQAATGENRHLERKLAFEGKEEMATVVVREAIGT